MAWFLLGVAITAEVAGTLALKATDGLSRLLPVAVVVAGYGTAFALLGTALRQLPVGLTYAIWSGVGTAGAALGGVWLFGERVSWQLVVGVVVIMAGVALVTSSAKPG